MTVLKIEKYPDSSPVLRKKNLPVEKIGDREISLLEDMAQTMYENKGIGLAAPQIGVNMRLVVVDGRNGLVKLINPRIVGKKNYETAEEGCLSLPNVYIKIKRAKKVSLEFKDCEGNINKLEADGLLARIIQHEIDHLDGRLIIDYVNPIRRFFLTRRLTKKASS